MWVLLLCNFGNPAYCDPPTIPYERIELKCVDMVSPGSMLTVVVRTEKEYEAFITERYTEPLQKYWDWHYPEILKTQKTRFPDKSNAEYQKMASDIIYEALPFRGTENCSHPIIDFQKYTLLGQAAHGSGCRQPDYTVGLTRDPKSHEIVFSVVVGEHGTCERAVNKNIWVLVPKLKSSVNVRFEKKRVLLDPK